MEKRTNYSIFSGRCHKAFCTLMVSAALCTFYPIAQVKAQDAPAAKASDQAQSSDDPFDIEPIPEGKVDVVKGVEPPALNDQNGLDLQPMDNKQQTSEKAPQDTQNIFDMPGANTDAKPAGQQQATKDVLGKSVDNAIGAVNDALTKDGEIKPLNDDGAGEDTTDKFLNNIKNAKLPGEEKPAEDNTEELFYDTDSIVPKGQMGAKSGPRLSNPETQPAMKYLVVKDVKKADALDTQVVAADRALKLGLYDSAMDMYDKLYAKNKRDPRILMGRAITLQHLQRFDEAMQNYQELVDIYPSNVEAQINMLGLLSARYPAVALQRLLDLREKNPDNVGVVAQIAVTEANLRDYDAAMRFLGVAASMEPENPSHVYNMAVVADRAGKKEEALKYYEKALEVDSIYGGGHTLPREQIYQRLAALR